jgi:uncharacterized protein YkwD
MPRLRTLVPSMALAIALAAPSGADASARSQMVSKINNLRNAHGVHGAHVSRSLSRGARQHAQRMLRNGYFGHAGSINAPLFSSRGEIIAMHSGGRAHVSRTVHMWANSPGHRSVMLSGKFSWVGAAKATGRWRGGRYTFWVVRFGRR